MSSRGIALCLALTVAGGAGSLCAQEKAAERKVSERLVVKIAPSAIPDSLKVSPDSKRIGYVVRSGSKLVMVVDGKEGNAYDGIGSILVFRSNGQHMAYVARSGNKQFVVVDGKEGQANGFLPRGSRIVFDSPDSLHYLAVRADGSVYLVEEKLQ